MIKNFSSRPIGELLQELASSPEGLSNSLAESRYREQQRSQHTETHFRRELKLLLRQFTNPLVLLLVVAVVLSAVLGEVSDTFIILFILLVTGLLSFYQEAKAGRAAEKLRKLIELKHEIVREGKSLQLSTNEIVPGDVLVLNAGDIIPADCRIIESNELHVNESTLTGESFPAEKMPGEVNEKETITRKHNCLWQSTNVVSGTARALVVHTGTETIFGGMARSLEREPETAFEKDIKHFGYFLLRITIILSLIILTTNIYFGRSLFDSILFSLALAVGMAPELLPAILTFAMSAGAKRMMKKKVIVKKLSSIFNLGEVNVLCTDKTGTITEGTIHVKDIVNAAGEPDEKVKLFAYINSAFQAGFQNPIDDAIKSLAVDSRDFEKLNEVPYDFIRKRLSIAVKHKEGNLIITKGALMNTLEVCTVIQAGGNEEPLTDDRRQKIQNQFSAYCENGFRVLGIAYKRTGKEKISRDDELQMTFLGFILLEDPLKESTIDSIERLERMNVNIKVITGDNRYAAQYAAKKLGMASPKIITGEMLHSMSPEALTVNVLTADVFAEIEPHQKERVVKSLQKSHMVVAYMGDGINDVAAIHAADTGISTNNAVDVAKEAADFVLLEKDLSVLTDGIYEGRISFVNSMKYIFIMTGAVFGNMFSVAAASFLLPFLPMLPKQILLTNLISDFPYLAIASDNVDEEELKSPRRLNLKRLRNFMIVFGIHSSIFDFITFFTLYYYFKLSGSAFQTGWFLESVITELVILYIVRTKRSFIKSKPGKLLLLTSLITFVITVWLPVSPFAGALSLSIAHLQQVISIALILAAYTITADAVKILFFRREKKGTA